MKLNRPFVFEPMHNKSDKPYGYAWLYKPSSDGTSFTVERSLASKLPETPDTIWSRTALHIIDGHEPGRSPFKRVIITSSNQDVWKNIESKESVTIHSMTIWTKLEIDWCYKYLYTNLDSVLINKMYQIWGGAAENC